MFCREFPFAHHVGPPAEVDGGGRKRFVHRHQKVSRPQNSSLGPERLAYRLTENDARVFDSVMLVHIEVASRREFQIHRSVACHKCQHVIEKWNSRRDFCAALSIEIQAHQDVCFSCGTAQIRFSHRQNFSKSLTLCITASAPNSRSLDARNRCASLPSGRTPKNGTRARLAARASSI